jgi:hypothetical protein
MIGTLKARDDLLAADMPVIGLAIVTAPEAPDGVHSYVKCNDDIVRIHWGGEVPGESTQRKAAAIIAANCTPPCSDPEIV